MLAVVGTVPDPRFPLVAGPVGLSGEYLKIRNQKVPVNRGTPALLAAAVEASRHLNGQKIYAFLVGDIGRGGPSCALYRFLEQHLPDHDMDVLAFHYLQPDVDWHNKVLFSVSAMKKAPVLIADAGFMYAAKMSGQARAYDIFTPDVGELAFLADELAPHPFYTRGFILSRNDKAPELILRAFQHENAAKYLLVKGETDYIAHAKEMILTVDHPSCDAMEAIGGTGDTLTGILTALCGAGFKPGDAAGLAARANRWAGFYANSTPATQVMELIREIPRALSKVLETCPSVKGVL